MSGLVFLLCICGCSVGNSPSTVSAPTPTPSPTPDVVGTGSWTATALSSAGQLSTIIVQFQDASPLSGQLQVLGDSAFDQSKSFPVTGSIDSSGKITFSGTESQETLSISATASADGTTLKGTYAVSGSITESGNIVGTHPPSVTGSYTGTYTDKSGDLMSESLALTPGSPVSGTFGAPITGTAQTSSSTLAQCLSVSNPASSIQFQFSGTQIGANVNGILMSGTTQWGELSGTLSSDGTTLIGTVSVANGNCAGTSLNGTVANTSKSAPTQQPSSQDITFSITNGGQDAGEVLINGQSVQCPAVPKGLTGGVSCGQIVVPAGAESVQVSAVPTVDGDYAMMSSPCPAVGGSSVEAPNLPFTCTWPAVPISDIAILPGQKLQEVVDVSFNPSNEQNSYVISDSPDGTAWWSVDDNLDVYRNGTLIYTTGNGTSSTHPPFKVLASIGDKLRFVTRDTYAGSSGLWELYLTCSASGSSVVADPGFITNPSSGGVTQDLTFTVPSVSGCTK